MTRPVKRPFQAALALGALAALQAAGAPAARAFESASTHAGMTARAAQHGHALHRWLARSQGLALGAYEPLQLDPARVPAAAREEMGRHLVDLDPVHGYRPDAELRSRAEAWLLAGAVLEGMPFSRSRHHFLDPRTGRGLRQSTGRRGQALRMRFYDFLEAQGPLGGVFTGANFDLTGMSALRWARHATNAYRLQTHLASRLAALTAPSARERQHHLAMALLSAGALLHLLQEMAVPAQVRNDFVKSYLAQRSNIPVDMASAYEVLVRRRYGRTGIPKVAPGASVPVFSRFDDYFTNRAGTGLADRTQARFFSLGTLPKPRRLQPEDTEESLHAAVQKSLPYPAPAVGRLHIRRSAKTGHAYYFGTAENPHLFAYRVSRRGVLEFTLDRKCHRAAAERLVPEAVRYGAGLLQFLLRGALALTVEGGGKTLRVTHAGPRLASGAFVLLWEDEKGTRAELARAPLPARAAASGPWRPGEALATFDLSRLPARARRLVVAFQGTDEAKEPLVLGALHDRR